MSIKARIGAWWSAWQFVVYLALALALSIAVNVWQWKRAITAPLRGENKELTNTLGTIHRIAKQATGENRGLTQELAVIVDRGRKERIVYRDAASVAPLAANCAPGKARADAVNQFLGPRRPSGEVK